MRKKIKKHYSLPQIHTAKKRKGRGETTRRRGGNPTRLNKPPWFQDRGKKKERCENRKRAQKAPDEQSGSGRALEEGTTGTTVERKEGGGALEGEERQQTTGGGGGKRISSRRARTLSARVVGRKTRPLKKERLDYEKGIWGKKVRGGGREKGRKSLTLFYLRLAGRKKKLIRGGERGDQEGGGECDRACGRASRAPYESQDSGERGGKGVKAVEESPTKEKLDAHVKRIVQERGHLGEED